MATPTCEDSELPAGSNSCHGYLPAVSWEIAQTTPLELCSKNGPRTNVEMAEATKGFLNPENSLKWDICIYVNGFQGKRPLLRCSL